MYRMYCRSDAASYLYKPIIKCINKNGDPSGVLRSSLSVAKICAKDNAVFAATSCISCPGSVREETLMNDIGYFEQHLLNETTRTDRDVFAIDTLAKIIRLDIKRRVRSDQHSYLSVSTIITEFVYYVV